MSQQFQQPQAPFEHKQKVIPTQLTIGLVVVLVGLGILLKRMDFPLPNWLFGWEMILILIGVITGINSKFKDVAWIILITIGLIFLSDDLLPFPEIKRYIWPIGIIVVGLVIAFRPGFGNRRRNHWMNETSPMPPTQPLSNFSVVPDAAPVNDANTVTDDVLDATAVFGGVKRSVVSKRFRGGEVVAVFGGAEINLAHADFEGTIKMEIVNVLGGTKLIVPADWDVQSVMVAVFGGVDDKRFIKPEMINPNKKLIIEGTSFLGGLEIKSY